MHGSFVSSRDEATFSSTRILQTVTQFRSREDFVSAAFQAKSQTSDKRRGRIRTLCYLVPCTGVHVVKIFLFTADEL